MRCAMSSEKTASYEPGGRSMEEILLALARRIRSERERQGVSQEDFARAANGNLPTRECLVD